MAKLKFLVIEDDLFYQTYVNDLLADSDVDIVNAQDGETGLALAVAEQPDLIITDIEIPKIQGFVLFKALRERSETRNIPVIMMSGKVEKALLDRHSSLSIHAEGYLPKPFSGQVLIDMIRSIVGDDFGFSEVTITPDAEEPLDHPEPAETQNAHEISQFPVEAPQDSAQVHVETGELTILVVDDSRYICDITTDFLKELGVRTEIASDGEVGYKKAGELLPDLVLLDVQMPNLNGFVVCEMLRKLESTKSIPIILMSAVVDDESFERHSKLRYHADAYLQKPFMKSELHELVRRFTSLGEVAPINIERKTGFFVPLEDADIPGETIASAIEGGDPQLLRKLEKAKAELEGKVARELQLEGDLKGMKSAKAQLEADLDNVRKTKDQLEAELFEMRKTVEGTQGGLHDKLTLATQRFEESRNESERLAEENRVLQARLVEVSSDGQGRVELEELGRKLEQKLKEKQEELDALMSENVALKDKHLEADSNLELKSQLTEFAGKLEEANAATLELENRNRLLNSEIEELKSREIPDPGDNGPDRQKLQEVIEGLTRDLKAAIAAKKEIEDQANSIIQNREKEDDTAAALKQQLEKAGEENQKLISRIAEAESNVQWLDEVKSQLEQAQSETSELRKQLDALPANTKAELSALKDELAEALKRADFLEKEKDTLSGSQGDMDELRSRNLELENLIEVLKEEGEQSQKLAASETEARMDLEGQLDRQAEEKAFLADELAQAKRQLDEGDEADDKILDLEKKLESERELRNAADRKIEELKAQFLEFAKEDEKIGLLEKDNKELKAVLRETRNRCEQLEKKEEQRKAVLDDEPQAAARGNSHLDDRLDQLEEVLGKTVLEAQNVLREQKDKETALEKSVESLMRALEEEKSAYRKDRAMWSEKESELKESFQDALRESRRLMGEEAARIYPMHMPGRSRYLEVVTWKGKYGVAAIAAVAALVIFAGGYLAKTRNDAGSGQVAIPLPGIAAVPDPQIPAGKPPKPWIASSGPEETYEELWRRNTVQSVSDDMMIQATLHTREELEAAIKYTAAKEGWTSEKTEKAMTDMAKTYNLSGAYYITVYNKNLKSGYPGYADSFEQHIALRDHSGREIRAHFPAELEGSKFISSRVSAAGKEMNPVFLYEVGLTVAFSREELAVKPSGLQLVLYDIGAVPMRVLTWDMSGIGSLL
ncbi:MAG: response regulator [bacterium]|nr:response regulator [bacterium]MDT8366138.1 response regulator [bacterium]